MPRFYIDVFARYPVLLVTAIERLIRGEQIAPRYAVQLSYGSFPTRTVPMRMLAARGQ